jgi:hypothetical protein
MALKKYFVKPFKVGVKTLRTIVSIGEQNFKMFLRGLSMSN